MNNITDKVKVISRYTGGLSIKDNNGKYYRWAKRNSILFLTKEKIKELYEVNGADKIFQKLKIEDEELAKEIMGKVEIEYNYSDKDVERLLTEGSLEQLNDALHFAPEGIIDLIITKATELKISDHNKRMLIEQKTGADINSRIENYEPRSEVIIDENKANQRMATPFVPENTGTQLR